MNLLLILILLFLLTNQDEQIKFVFQIHRHGARAPIFNLTKQENKYIDIYKEEWFLPEELTETGKRMHYLVGVHNRKKYIEDNEFLSKNYNPYEILVKSTDVNRTLMSIYAQLQGLYPQNTFEEIDKNVYYRNPNLIYPQNFLNDNQLLKQINEKYKQYFERNSPLPNKITIIPVHNFNYKSHEIQLYSPDYCPGIKNSYEEGKKSEIMKNLVENLSEDLVNKLKIIANLSDINFLEDYYTLFGFMDTYVADIYDDRELKVLEENNVNIDELNKTAYDFLLKDYEFVNYFNNITSIYSMSPILREILFYMNDIIINDGDNEHKVKYIIFSGHDTNIAGFEIFNNKMFDTPVEYANFAQTEYYELFLNDSEKLENEDNYYVRYLRGDNVKFEIDYKSFKNKIMENLWTDKQIYKFCNFDVVKIKSKNLKIATIILSIIDSILIIFLIILIKIIIKKKNYNKIENDIDKLHPLNSFKKNDN